jgi:hypothetical protein
MKLSESKLIEILKSIEPENPVYKAIMQMARQQADDEKVAALMPGLLPEARAYNCGRCAAMEDFIAIVNEMRSEPEEFNLTLDE